MAATSPSSNEESGSHPTSPPAVNPETVTAEPARIPSRTPEDNEADPSPELTKEFSIKKISKDGKSGKEKDKEKASTKSKLRESKVVAAPSAPGTLLEAPDNIWDTDAWVSRLQSIFSLPYSKQVSDAYEKFLQQFPTSGRYWRNYAEHAQKQGPDKIMQEIKEIYERGCKLASTSIELWKSYISFAKTVLVAVSRQEVIQVYEKATRAIGLDGSSQSVWSDYIDFVQSWRASTSLEDNQRRDLLRKIYQRAVQSPLQNLDQLWKEYEAFQNQSMNKDLAKGLLAEMQPKYFEARSEFRARKSRKEGLVLNVLATPPRGDEKEEDQASMWRKYLAQERANTGDLSADDLHLRVAYAYEQALAVLYRYPDMWIDAAQYQLDAGKPEMAESLLERARVALPDSSLIWIFSCDLLELHEKQDRAQALYEIMKNNSNMNTTLVYSAFYKYTRRQNGIEAARKAFLDARKRECGWELYALVAWTEHRSNKETLIAENVFELGMKKFGTQIPFILEYVEFLWQCNEEDKIRVFFDRVLDSLPKSDVKLVSLWDRYVEFESAFGDLVSRNSAVRRRSEALSTTAPNPGERKRMRVAAGSEQQRDLSMFLPAPVDIALEQCTILDLEPVNPHEKAEILLRRSELDSGFAVAAAKPVSSASFALKSKEPKRNIRKDEREPQEYQKLSLEEGLARLIASIPASIQSQPPPDLSFVMNLISKVPVSFEDTPAGKRLSADDDQRQGGRNKRKSSGRDNDDDDDNQDGENAAGKKESKRLKKNASANDDDQKAWSVRAQAPQVDVFRQRQAAKQSKLR